MADTTIKIEDSPEFIDQNSDSKEVSKWLAFFSLCSLILLFGSAIYVGTQWKEIWWVLLGFMVMTIIILLCVIWSKSYQLRRMIWRKIRSNGYESISEY